MLFLDGGRKPEYPERTHAYTGRTCKLHTERLGTNPLQKYSITYDVEEDIWTYQTKSEEQSYFLWLLKIKEHFFLITSHSNVSKTPMITVEVIYCHVFRYDPERKHYDRDNGSFFFLSPAHPFTCITSTMNQRWILELWESAWIWEPTCKITFNLYHLSSGKEGLTHCISWKALDESW